jgi:hypothetical protein
MFTDTVRGSAASATKTADPLLLAFVSTLLLLVMIGLPPAGLRVAAATSTIPAVSRDPIRRPSSLNLWDGCGLWALLVQQQILLYRYIIGLAGAEVHPTSSSCTLLTWIVGQVMRYTDTGRLTVWDTLV